MLLKVPRAASSGRGGRFVIAVTLPGVAEQTGPLRDLTLE